MQLQEFEKSLIISTNLQPKTITSHIQNVKRICTSLNTYFPTEQQISDYVFELKKSSFSYNHVVNNIVSIEKYSSFCGVDVSFARPKKPKRLIKDFLSEAEVSRIIGSCNNIREKAIISLLAYSGIRNKELCGLRVSDVDLGDNTVRVIKGKNCRDRVVNMASECTKVLIKYLNDFPRDEDSFLFTTLVNGNKYGSSDLRKLVNVLSERARIGRNVFPHMFRTSLASNLLKRGAGILTIKEQLGHSDLSSTLIYLSSCPERAKCEYDFFKPAYI